MILIGWCSQYGGQTKNLNAKKSSNYSLGQKKKYVCLRSPDLPYFSAADPNLFYRQLFDINFW